MPAQRPGSLALGDVWHAPTQSVPSSSSILRRMADSLIYAVAGIDGGAVLLGLLVGLGAGPAPQEGGDQRGNPAKRGAEDGGQGHALSRVIYPASAMTAAWMYGPAWSSTSVGTSGA